MSLTELLLRFQVAREIQRVGGESNQLRISFGSIFLLFCYWKKPEAKFAVAGENPRPPPLNDSPALRGLDCLWWMARFHVDRTKSEILSTKLMSSNIVTFILSPELKKSYCKMRCMVFYGLNIWLRLCSFLTITLLAVYSGIIQKTLQLL